LATAVAKFTKPLKPSDFRPISVISILSWLTEGFIVCCYLFPAIPENELTSQFAYTPTDSTTAVLIYLIIMSLNYWKIATMSVRCLMIDYTKAFDCINHNILAHKLARLGLPYSVLNRIINFLTERTHLGMFIWKITNYPKYCSRIGAWIWSLYAVYSSDL